MTRPVIITCALTGDSDTPARSPHVPVTPGAIAEDAIAAARAGAAVVHIHVRDPTTTEGSRDPALYREAVGRVRASGVDVVLNLTAGMGGKLVLGERDPLPVVPTTDLVGAIERMVHVEELRPELCSLDCGSFNYGAGNDVYISTAAMIRAMAERMLALGVKPELEVFDFGHLRLAATLVDAGIVAAPHCSSSRSGCAGGRRPTRARCCICVTSCRPTRCGSRSARVPCRCRWRPSRSCSAGMCGSGWRTISIAGAACWRPIASWWRMPSAWSRRWAPDRQRRTRRASFWGCRPVGSSRTR